MKQVISSERIPIKLWLNDADEKTLDQAKNLANLPFAYKWVSLMPDAHCGYGMPIGGVLAAKGVIIPYAVGFDIGCGMCALQLPLQDISKDNLKEILGKIRQRIPVGFNHHKEPQDPKLMPGMNLKMLKGWHEVVNSEYNSALHQIGTLGGGNHFIEIQKGSDGYIWIMVHSGSRNLGYKVAKHYNNLAKERNEQWHTQVPPSYQLAFLPVDSMEGLHYRGEMDYCVDFAFCNRKLMMSRIIECFNEFEFYLSPGGSFTKEITTDNMINIAHNYAAMENHFGKNVMVHRKGATLARKGTVGIIPGSQGTKSYIVKGKGNPESFQSCSHGAGRKMSRTKAKADLSLFAEQALLNSQNILHSIRGENDLDEAPSAYKNIETVMDNQRDLVDVTVELQPLAVVKG